jgi:hypothetical protein
MAAIDLIGFALWAQPDIQQVPIRSNLRCSSLQPINAGGKR